MSRLSNNKGNGKKVTNFMGENSFELNPISTLKMVAASSIFGEPSYYRGNGIGSKSFISQRVPNEILGSLIKDADSTTDVFTKAINEALNFDFGATLDLAEKLRNEYNMRLNPSVIFIEAAIHPKRKDFTAANPGTMAKLAEKILIRPDDMKNMFDYYIFANGSKKGLPTLVKRAWAKKLQTISKYHAAKYKSKGLIDLVRIAHPKPTPIIKELMSTGTVEVTEDDQTWEKLKSQGKDWKEIFATIKIPHMALLRNLRGIFKEVNDSKFAKEVLDKLKSGVPYGRQFPFRYYTAYKFIENETLNHKTLILDALEECMDAAMANFPRLEGKVASLSDNSGSAWGSLSSEYGSVTIADIGNLSSVITCTNADEGYAYAFGDRLSEKAITKRGGVLAQHKDLNRIGNKVGGGTENGVWLFWEKAIKNKEHFDHVFIYSDMQAGRGGLYGTNPSQYANYQCKSGNGYRSSHIDVLKLVEEYRKTVNSKVNVYTIQTAGYDNNIMPENLYRTAVLTGWTGKEVVYAKEMADIWDEIETNQN